MLGPKYQTCYDLSSTPQTVDPRQLDYQTMDLPSTVYAEVSNAPPFHAFRKPEHAPPRLSQFEGIQPASTTPDIVHDTSDGAWNQALQPPQSFHANVPADYPPHHSLVSRASMMDRHLHFHRDVGCLATSTVPQASGHGYSAS